METAGAWLAHPNIVAIMGIRRAGKSVFSHFLGRDWNFAYINFDDERLRGVTADDLDSILEAFYVLYGDPELVILDEIQDIQGWELFANRLRRTKRVIVTGSNSSLLSGELSTKLTGRYVEFTLYPFSFKEYLEISGIAVQQVYTTKEKAAVMKALEGYLHFGGFPEVKTVGPAIIRAIYDGVITKDILLRWGIKKKDDLRKLAKFLVSNYGGEITYTRLAGNIGIRQVSTVSDWISHLEEVFLIMVVERFSYKLKQQFRAPKKVYCVDNGIVHMIGFSPTESIGRLMENAVAVELHRRKALGQGIEIYYWKDHQQREVDFVLKDNSGVKELIQVTLASGSDEIRGRETEALVRASKALRCSNMTIITSDYEGKIGGANCIPVWKWLLSGNVVKNGDA